MNKLKGFSLLEVLVTLVLTTVGILGMVAMQSRSIEYTQDSVQRNTAVMLSNELVEIMRANPSEIFEPNGTAGVLFGKFKTESLFLKSAGASFATPPSACENPSAALTAQEQRDCWVTKVQNSLPEAINLFNNAFYICQSSTRGVCDARGSVLEIQIAWAVKDGACPAAGAPNSTTCIYRTRVEI